MSTACRCCFVPRRRLRQSRARPGAAAGRGLCRRHGLRQRLLPPGEPLFRPDQRPEHLLTALPRALRVMTDPADCGPVTLAFCQDVQAEAYDYPESFFEPKRLADRRPHPDPHELAPAVDALRRPKTPVIVAGGGVHYSEPARRPARALRTPRHPRGRNPGRQIGAALGPSAEFRPIGVTGGDARQRHVCAEADLVIGVGTRFQDFTTGSWALFKNPAGGWSASTCRPMTRQARRAAAGRGCQGGAGRG
jgi:TPP-dependent trihydroxycyclohexane-1,2-dione (THcHDO) dehydratase